MIDWKRMTEGISGTIELTEDSSQELLRILEEQEAEFLNELLEGKRDLTIMGSDGRSVELTPKAKEGEWIPCEERLPEEEGRYYVTRHDDVTNTEFIDILWYEENLWWNRHSTGDYAVTAWMPLPEPWKGTAE